MKLTKETNMTIWMIRDQVSGTYFGRNESFVDQQDASISRTIEGAKRAKKNRIKQIEKLIKDHPQEDKEQRERFLGTNSYMTDKQKARYKQHLDEKTEWINIVKHLPDKGVEIVEFKTQEVKVIT